MKPNSTPIYVNRKSNHPRSVLENIPKSVNLRLIKISSSKEIFDSACPPYQEALNKSGYNYKLTFNPNLPSARNEPNRKRNITYFNPPFSCSVKTNIGGKFLRLIDSLFPEGHTLKQIINRNTVKISYRCMPNLKKKISNHNFRILKSEEQSQEKRGCNCTRAIGDCPMDGNCLVDSLIYRAEVTDENNNLHWFIQ